MSTTARGLFDPFFPSDPCRLLATVPIRYGVTLNADGSFGAANARVGSVDTVPVLG